ncbi:MAG: ParA family protein [Planctomycetes bacterium]|nr:ParA family protein [Planctomycetota bacterium]
MKTIAVVNQKGGCGKTTTSINLAAALAEQQRNVLLMDLDPQAHATIGFGLDPDNLQKTVYEAATSPGVNLTDVLVPTAMPHLTLAPSSVMLASTDVELARTPGRELILGRLLKSVREQYDLCVMDCAPSFGVLTIGALIAASDVIVPVQAQYYSLEGLRRVMETIRLIRERYHPCSAENLRILLTLVEARTTLSKQIQLQMREIFGALIFQTVIHNDVRLSEAPSAGESVLQYAPRSRGAKEYRAVAAEVLGDVAPVEPGRGGAARRGIQKDLSALFNDVLTAAPRGGQRPTPMDSQATGDPGRESDRARGAARDNQIAGAEVPCALNLEIPFINEQVLLSPPYVSPPPDSDTPEALHGRRPAHR